MKAINYFIVFPERENEEGRSLRKKADISSRYYWFPCEMTSEERVQIWVVPLIVRIARKICLNQSEANQKHYPDLRSVVSGVSIPDIMSGGNQCWRLKMSAVFSG